MRSSLKTQELIDLGRRRAKMATICATQMVTENCPIVKKKLPEGNSLVLQQEDGGSLLLSKRKYTLKKIENVNFQENMESLKNCAVNLVLMTISMEHR